MQREPTIMDRVIDTQLYHLAAQIARATGNPIKKDRIYLMLQHEIGRNYKDLIQAAIRENPDELRSAVRQIQMGAPAPEDTE